MILHPLPRGSVPALVVAALSLPACDALTDEDYQGEPLVTLRGTVTDKRSALASPSDVNLYLVWRTASGDVPHVVEPIELNATLPATFQLDVFKPPPLEDRDIYFGARVTYGVIVAATSDAQLPTHFSEPRFLNTPGLLGVDPRHMILYAADGFDEGTHPAALFHGPAAPGFHVHDVKCLGPQKRAEVSACLEKYPPLSGDYPALQEQWLVRRLDCGLITPDGPWIQPAAADLSTELTVELIDDLEHYEVDPSECI